MLRKLALGAALVLTGLLVAAPAQAAVTCTYSSAQARVDVAMSTPADVVTVSRSGLKIMANALQCGTATVKNTNVVYVTADAAEQTVVLQLSGGAFAPGKTKEPRRGISEIEFRVNLGGGTDTVTVVGGAQADTIRLGTGGMNLNGDGDADLLATGVDKWEIAAGGGADTVSGAGAFGTGGKYGWPLVITGDAGNDTLTGGSSADSVYGGAGNDRMSGGGGTDFMLGEAGRDRLDGGDGPDQLTPGTGKDLVYGGAGTDLLYGEAGLDGADDMHGGVGRDSAYYYLRTGNLKVSLDDHANDGQTGEKDNVHSDIESITSGSGNDRLVGSSGGNSFDSGVRQRRRPRRCRRRQHHRRLRPDLGERLAERRHRRRFDQRRRGERLHRRRRGRGRALRRRRKRHRQRRCRRRLDPGGLGGQRRRSPDRRRRVRLPQLRTARDPAAAPSRLGRERRRGR